MADDTRQGGEGGALPREDDDVRSDAGGGSDADAPGRRPRWIFRFGHGLVTVLGVFAFVAAGALLFLTQTGYGRDASVTLIERALSGAVNGEIRVGRILAGNLLTRAVIETLEIRDREGELFLAMDTVRVEYDPSGFLFGRITLRDVDAVRAEIRFIQDTAGVWNVDRLFSGPPADSLAAVQADSAPRLEEESANQDGLRLALNDVRIRSGRFELRQPWDGSSTNEPTIWRLERGLYGWVEQVIELDDVQAGFPLLRIADPSRPMQFDIEGLTAVANVVTQPLEILALDGRAVLGDTVDISIDDLRLPASRLSGAGWVLPGDPIEFRFDLAADPAGFSDLQWLPLPVPADGGGPIPELVVRTEAGTVFVDAAGGDVRFTDTRLRGGFSLALEETPRLASMSMQLDPLRLALVDELLEREPAIDGYATGTVRGSGRLDDLALDADLVLRDVEEPGADSSRVEARGGVSLIEPFPLSELDLVVGSFEPRWTRFLGFDTGLDGRLDGTASLDGVPGGLLAFDGDLSHRAPGGQRSRVAGRGSFDLGGGSVVDVRLTTAPLALAVLDPYAPELGLQGEIRGPIEARGSLSDLEANADLETPRGRLRFDGRFDVAADQPTYDARFDASGIALEQWREDAPQTDLAVQGRVVGQGVDPATLVARFDLEILPSVVQEARIDTARLRFSFSDGLATVDTFLVDSDVGRVQGFGSFGLSDPQTGALILVASVPRLSSWNRWVLEEIPATDEAAPTDVLLAELDPGAADTEAPTGIDGILAARGVLFGNLDMFSFGGSLIAIDVRYEGHSADSVVARLDINDPTSTDSLVLNGRIWDAELFGERADSLTARFARLGPGLADLRLFAERDSTLRLAVESGLLWTEARYEADLRRFALGAGEDSIALARPARLVYGDSVLYVQDLELRGPGTALTADGAVAFIGSGRLDIAAENLDLAQIAQLWPEPPDIGGELSMDLTVRGTLAAPLLDGSIEVREPKLGASSHGRLTSTFQYAARQLEGEVRLEDGSRLLARADGTIRTNLAIAEVEDRLAEDAFDFRVEADSLPFAMAELIAGGLEDTEGYLRGDVRVQGNPGSLRYDGSVRLLDGATSVPNLGVRFVGISGAATFVGSDARVSDITLTSVAGGDAVVNGTVDIATITDPQFDLAIEANRLLPIDRFAMTFVLEGEGHLGGRFTAPLVTGGFRLRDGDIRSDEFLRARQIIDLTDPDVYSLVDTTLIGERRLLERVRNPFMQNLRMDVELALGPNLWLRSDAMDMELGADSLNVSMDRTTQSISVTGTVNVQRGSYRFDIPAYRTQLRVTRGTVDFVGDPEVNPVLDVTAEYRTRTPSGAVTVTADIRGRMRSQPEITLTSNPPMSDSDQICFIALGSPCYGTNDAALGERLIQRGVLGTLSSGLSSALVGSGGLSYLNLRATGALDRDFGDNATQNLLARTELEIGRYAGENVFFLVGIPLGGGVPRATVEWRFSENWTLEARAENRFDQQQYGLYRGTNNILNEQTYGLFIFREWSFD